MYIKDEKKYILYWELENIPIGDINNFNNLYIPGRINDEIKHNINVQVNILSKYYKDNLIYYLQKNDKLTFKYFGEHGDLLNDFCEFVSKKDIMNARYKYTFTKSRFLKFIYKYQEYNVESYKKKIISFYNDKNINNEIKIKIDGLFIFLKLSN